ncbi:cysteine proteinase [Stemphylium lycopersici]|uniref:Cysteine proteinase n=1 Tax=Stemphylium lycopersici TaxID=183478 RepID=A0A364N4V3_STELY|nr:cysteine proteinase [Stemphylium lycopersici]
MGSDSGDDSPTGAPQEAINDFWDNLITKKPAKVTKIFPPSLYANLLPPQRNLGTVTGRNAAESYKAAAAECRARVKRVVKECIRTNEKFTDPDFDIENLSDKNCLEGLMYWYKEQTTSTPAVSASQLGRALSTLVQSGVFMGDGAAFDFSTTAKLLSYKSSRNSAGSPRSVHRIDWIFDKPEFVIDGFSSSDLKQGSSGDCWFIAAVATICSNPALMNKVCVARDEECGVYGFVFYRDGEWIWTVIDDNLYLSQSDFDAEWGDRYDPTNARETKYKKNYQTGSEALYFASCADENETWLPLLEKAYAKVHGDYDAIAGGWSGEAVEDLTGGVTTKVMTNRVLSKEKLWKELLQVGQKFLFSASSPSSGAYGDDADARRGLALSHAYSVLKAVEDQDQDGNKVRLVQIRNPWGRRENARIGEWTGPWSDGSSEWTPYWLEKLDYKFGDDGLFWMSYDEILKRFDLLDRTRIFDEQWTVVQRWTSVSVAWVTGYLNVKFSVEIKKAGPTVFVLCQLDERYFKGLEGKYEFDLHFILQEKDAAAGDHLVRARGPWFGNRSISAEVELEAGVYEVLPKIVATRDADVPDVQEVVSKLAERNPQKLKQIGINYDIANAKGVFEQSEEERKKKEQKRKEAAEKKAKEKEAEEQAKADFEAWKKEEKAEYEVWKRKKERKEKERGARSKEDLKDSETQTEQSETTTSSTDDTKNEGAAPSPLSPSIPKKDKTQNDTVDLAIRTADPEGNISTTTTNDTTSDTPDTSQEITTSLHSPTNPESNSTAHTPATSETPDSLRPSPPPPPQPPHFHPSNIPSPVSPPPVGPQLTPSATAAAKEEPKPWNAVCVIGLRVYSFDPEVSIQFVKPKSVEEAAFVAVDGDGVAAAAAV